MREFTHETEANSFLKESSQLRLSAGPFQTDCRHTAFGSACSRPVTQDCWLLVGNVTTISMISAPAQGHKRKFVRVRFTTGSSVGCGG